MNKSIFFILLFSIIQLSAFSQTDLMEAMNALNEENQEPEYVYATFKSTRIINSHTVDFESKGELQFLLGHRFGTINSGFSNLFGIDAATMRLGFEYGLIDELAVGIGRSTFNKVWDGYVKYGFIKQKKSGIPLSAVIVGSTHIRQLDMAVPNIELSTNHYLTYSLQVLLARKFNRKLSLQLMPTYLHRNFVSIDEGENDLLSLGIGGRYKLGNRFALTTEYYHSFSKELNSNYNSPLSLGFEIETGGHVFQFHVSNSLGMTENLFITQTTGSWADGDIRLGFNISRVFQIKSQRP